jgi:hypothetical protein
MATSWRKGASGRGGMVAHLLHLYSPLPPPRRARAVTEPTRRRTPKAPIHSRSRTRMILPDSRLGIGRETGSSLFPHPAAGGDGKWGPDWPQIGKSGEITRPRECPAARRATILGCQWTLLCLSTGQLAMSDKKTTMSLGRRATPPHLT